MCLSPYKPFNIDVSEDRLREEYSEEFNLLLLDQTTKKNIFWATSDYQEQGDGYEYSSQILPDLITGNKGNFIMPRIKKTSEVQRGRIKENAEVFTPSWVCNAQNNLIDEAWFGRKDVFNREYDDHTWEPTKGEIEFPNTKEKRWEDYVRDTRLEITCGEAPYLVSRYDTTTGKEIPIEKRIGLLDRKLRVVKEHTEKVEEWWEWTQIAYKNIYGYEWQGDNLLIARENLFATFCDYYSDKFQAEPPREYTREIARIISWNLWQMDGLKCVVPETCHEETVYTLFDEEKRVQPCEGCQADDISKIKSHNGTPCKIMDWNETPEGKPIEFRELLKKMNSYG